MMRYPEIDPVALSLGIVHVHWYGVMYLLGFAAAWGLGRWQAGRAHSGWTSEQVDDLIFYGAIGVILGGRLGYTLFYNFSGFLANPLSLLAVWQGGMSFHGGLLGVIAAFAWFARKHHKSLFQVTDFSAPLVPLGLFAGRIGNFINGELWGKASDLPWAMELPCYRLPQMCEWPLESAATTPALHPSQLYQAGLEGLLLFLLLWWFASRPRPLMAVSGLFLLGYGVFRFLVEFVRLPDSHLGYLAFNWVTMGQLLSLPMILGGALLLLLAYRRGARRSG